MMEKEPGTLSAKWTRSDWMSSETDHGLIYGGLATGGPAKGFCGNYSIRYADENGELGAPYDLKISSAGDAYELVWRKHGEVLYTGVGMNFGGGLVVGWGPGVN
jgi:hypothetical protein